MGWLSSPPHQGGLPRASLGERWVQEMGMENILFVFSSQKSHTSCSESQKGSLVLACTYTQGKTRSRTQTDGNVRLRINLEHSNTSGPCMIWYSHRQHLQESLKYPNVFPKPDFCSKASPNRINKKDLPCLAIGDDNQAKDKQIDQEERHHVSVCSREAKRQNSEEKLLVI